MISKTLAAINSVPDFVDARAGNGSSKLSSFPKHDSNPFVEKAITEVHISKKYRTIKGSNSRAIMQMVEPSSGEVMGHTMFMRQIEVDEERFTKVYMSQFDAFWDLPKSAIRVFGYIMTKLKPKLDTFDFRVTECMKHSRYSTKKPIYEGLAALVEAGIIARGFHEYIYYINPLIAFNGDRVSYVKTYVKKKAEDTYRSAISQDPGQLKISLA